MVEKNRFIDTDLSFIKIDAGEVAENNGKDNLEKLQIHLAVRQGNKVYLETGENAPEGKVTRVGPKGGRYYEVSNAPARKPQIKEVAGYGNRKELFRDMNDARVLWKAWKRNLDLALSVYKKNPNTANKAELEAAKEYFKKHRNHFKNARADLVRLENKIKEERNRPEEKFTSASDDEHEKKLQSTPIKADKHLGGGCNETRIITMEDGTKAVFKPLSGETRLREHCIPQKTFYKREVAAYKLCKFLGWDYCPPTTLREIKGEIGSVQQYIEGAGELPYRRDMPDIFGNDEVCNMAAYNLIMWNTDRHSGNALAKGKKIIAIDHGLCFPRGNGSAGDFFSVFYDAVRNNKIPDSTMKQLKEAYGRKNELKEILKPLLEPKVIDFTISRIKAIIDIGIFEYDDIYEKAIKGE